MGADLAANSKVLVLVIVKQTTAARTGGAPTWKGTAMTQSGTAQAGAAECNSELWYLIDPSLPDGELLIPNTGAATLYYYFITLTGTGASLVNSAQTGTTVANPSLTINSVPAGGAIVGVLGDGSSSPPSARSHTNLSQYDPGVWTMSAQYGLIGSPSNVTMSWTVASDDVAMHMIAFQEVSGGNTYNESVTLSAAVAVANAVARILNLSVTLQASGSVGPDPVGSTYNPSMILSALATISPSAQAILLAGATLQATAAQVASGGMAFDNSVVMSAAAVLAAAASLTMGGSINLQAQAGYSDSASALLGASMSLLAGAGITPQAQAQMVGATSLNAGAACATQGQLLLDAIMALAASAGNIWEGEVVTSGVFYEAVALVASATLSPQTIATLQAIANLVASGTITASSTALMEAALTLLTVAEFGTVGELTSGGTVLGDILITLLRRRRNR